MSGVGAFCPPIPRLCFTGCDSMHRWGGVRAPMEPTMLRYVCPHCGSKDAAPDKALHMRLPG